MKSDIKNSSCNTQTDRNIRDLIPDLKFLMIRVYAVQAYLDVVSDEQRSLRRRKTMGKRPRNDSGELPENVSLCALESNPIASEQSW
jgi:hypothetical protein